MATWYPPVSTARMIQSGILQMSPMRAIPFKPRTSGEAVVMAYGPDVRISADSVAELKRLHEETMAQAAAYPAPIWC